MLGLGLGSGMGSGLGVAVWRLTAEAGTEAGELWRLEAARAPACRRGVSKADPRSLSARADCRSYPAQNASVSRRCSGTCASNTEPAAASGRNCHEAGAAGTKADEADEAAKGAITKAPLPALSAVKGGINQPA